jgi:hypothetical protein
MADAAPHNSRPNTAKPGPASRWPGLFSSGAGFEPATLRVYEPSSCLQEVEVVESLAEMVFGQPHESKGSE